MILYCIVLYCTVLRCAALRCAVLCCAVLCCAVLCYETLPHVLCHCRPNMPTILRRHNSIVDRIVNAVQRGCITTDQQVRAAKSRLRPDIIVEKRRKC